MKSENLNQTYSSNFMTCDTGNEVLCSSQDEILQNAVKAMSEKQAEYLKEISMEILKKADIKGSTERIAGEYIRIYNMLNTLLNTPKTTKIPKQTVFKDYIICLEDGKKMQMLKRHLKVKYHMSFQDYKRKWGLPIDYPDTAEKYSLLRSEIAKRKRNRKKSNTDTAEG